jgi:hypothetical protein
VWHPAGRPGALDFAPAGPRTRAPGDRGDDLVRDRAADLKANRLQPWLQEQWGIPPEANAACVGHLEDVLDVYTRPYDPRRPQVRLDETSRQLRREVRAPRAPAPGQPARYDAEYERAGGVNCFLVCEPRRGWREVRVSDQRTRVDWAHCVKDWIGVHLPEAEALTLVMDPLNTHSPASLYEAFPPAEANRLADQLELPYTPKHGSGLDRAEIELSSLQRQCLNRRLPARATVEQQVAAWGAARNAAGHRLDWRFPTKDARIKLNPLYPAAYA